MQQLPWQNPSVLRFDPVLPGFFALMRILLRIRVFWFEPDPDTGFEMSLDPSPDLEFTISLFFFALFTDQTYKI